MSKIAIFACFIGRQGPNANQILWIRELFQCEFFDQVLCVYASAHDQVWDPLLMDIFKHRNDVSFKVLHCQNNALKDIALFKNALQTLTAETYETIALINDSCDLVAPLKTDLFRKHSEDPFWGLTLNRSGVPPNSYAGQVLRKDNSHLQSYFLVVSRNAIPILIHFQKDIELPMNCTSTEKIQATQYKTVDLQEVGLSQTMLSKGFPLVAEFSHSRVQQELQFQFGQSVVDERIDLTQFLGPQLVFIGSPCLKRKRKYD